MKRNEAKKPARKAQAQPVVHLAGEVFEAARKEAIRNKSFPRAFYASSLTRGYARLDGKDEIGKLLGDSGESIRVRVMNAWRKAGHVVVEFEGQLRLGIVVYQ
jgi:hypothetical protein